MLFGIPHIYNCVNNYNNTHTAHSRHCTLSALFFQTSIFDFRISDFEKNATKKYMGFFLSEATLYIYIYRERDREREGSSLFRLFENSTSLSLFIVSKKRRARARAREDPFFSKFENQQHLRERENVYNIYI